jgi:hypothetical protein
MQINPPQTRSVQAAFMQQMQDFAVIGQRKHWQIRQHPDNFGSSCQVAARQLADDKRMSVHSFGLKQPDKLLIPFAEVVCPD